MGSVFTRPSADVAEYVAYVPFMFFIIYDISIAHAYVRRAPCWWTSSTLLLHILETPLF